MPGGDSPGRCAFLLLSAVGEAPVSPARGPPADWGELVQVHGDRAIFQASPDELPVIDIQSL
jgi:hypothetical protein